MRLFAATRAGGDSEDYSHTVEGEMVRLPVICDDPECDCANAMTGMGSGLSTTTFTVREFGIDQDTYHDLLWGTLERDGWVEEGDPEDEEWVRRLVGLHLDLASNFTPGIPLRLAGDRLSERR